MESSLETELQNLEKQLARGDLDGVIARTAELLVQFPDSEAFTILKATAERRKKLMSASRGASSVSFQQIKCPSCARPLAKLNAESQGIVCDGCGAGVALSSGEVKLTGENFGASNFPYSKSLALGTEGTLLGQRQQVIGKIYYIANTEEWDSEDSCYTSEQWEWEEVTLLGEDRSIAYLVFDKEGVSISRPFIPDITPSPEMRPTLLSLDSSGVHRVQERGTAYIDSIEGEFSWVPKKSETVVFAEYSVGETLYSVETRMEDGVAIEVEHFTATAVDWLVYFSAFGLSEELAAYKAALKQRREFALWTAAFLVVAFCLFAIGLSAGSGKAILTTEYPQISAIADDGDIVGPVYLSKPGEIYAIKLDAQLADNSEAWAGVELLDQNQDAVNAAQGEFWRESGYDDGNWSESDVSSTKYFRLETPGTYFLRVFGEPGSRGSLKVALREGVELSRYHVASACLCLFLALVFSLKSFSKHWGMVAEHVGSDAPSLGGKALQVIGVVLFIIFAIWLEAL